MWAKAAIGLGGNATSSEGGPDKTLCAALQRLQSDSVRVVAVSRFYRSAAYPAGSGPDYVNAAAVVETDLTPEVLLAHLMRVEALLGRVRQERWGPRTIDLDLLMMGDVILPDRATYDRWLSLSPERQQVEAPAQLILPHPRLQDRAFVLIPMADIAAAWVHPVLGQTVGALCAALPEAAKAAIWAN